MQNSQHALCVMRSDAYRISSWAPEMFIGEPLTDLSATAATAHMGTTLTVFIIPTVSADVSLAMTVTLISVDNRFNQISYMHDLILSRRDEQHSY